MGGAMVGLCLCGVVGLPQRFKVAKGLALEVRADLNFVCVVWLVC